MLPRAEATGQVEVVPTSCRRGLKDARAFLSARGWLQEHRGNMKTCRAPGCDAPAVSRYAAYCSIHKARLRRQGALDQASISKAAVEPYLKRVRARIAKNQHNAAWAILDERWRALVEHGRGIIASYHAGKPGQSNHRLAAHEVVKLGDDVAPRAVVETVLAMVLMLEMEPARFRTDAAFRSQLVRRVRGLTDVNFGESWDQPSGKVKRFYRDFPPRAAAVLGQWLVETLGIGGKRIAQLERAEAEKAAGERVALHKALGELK